MSLSKEQTAAAYTAYAELEAAAETLYNAAQNMGLVLPQKAAMLNTLCEDVNFAIVEIDAELDEVI